MDPKDLEIARLKGQIEALEKQIARLSPQPLQPFVMPSVPALQPTYVPPPYVKPPFIEPLPIGEQWRAGGIILDNPDLRFAAGNAACAPNPFHGVTVFTGTIGGAVH